MAYPGSSAQLRFPCISAGTGVGRGSLKYLTIPCLTLGLSRGVNEVTLPFVSLGTIRPEDSGAARNATEFQH